MFLFSLLLLVPISAVSAIPANPNHTNHVRQFGPEPSAAYVPNASSFVFAGDAPYGVTTQQLSSVLNCPNDQPSATTKTVLLVHGTGSTGYESWAHGYVPALTAAGFTTCYISIPKRSSGDVQQNSAFVAYNIHLVSSLSGNNPISVIGHSQGGPNIQWALRFFPSTRPLVRLFIGLSPDLGPGTTYFRTMCGPTAANACDAASWQQASNSNFFAALNHKNTAFAPSTFIWTSADQIVTPPQPNAMLAGAQTIEVQSICPSQMPDHFGQLINPATYAIALDALVHGSVDPARIPPSACTGFQAPGMDITIPVIVQSALNDILFGSLLALPKLTAEPPVLPYAQIQNQ